MWTGDQGVCLFITFCRHQELYDGWEICHSHICVLQGPQKQTLAGVHEVHKVYECSISHLSESPKQTSRALSMVWTWAFTHCLYFKRSVRCDTWVVSTHIVICFLHLLWCHHTFCLLQGTCQLWHLSSLHTYCYLFFAPSLMSSLCVSQILYKKGSLQ